MVNLTFKLECCFERERRVPDLGLTPLRPDDSNHVEPGWRLRNAVTAEVKVAGLGQLMVLECVYLFFGRWVVVGASLDLYEHEHVAIPRDDVDLAHIAAEVAGDDLEAPIAKEARGDIFTPVAQCVALSRLGWALSLLVAREKIS